MQRFHVQDNHHLSQPQSCDVWHHRQETAKSVANHQDFKRKNILLFPVGLDLLPKHGRLSWFLFFVFLSAPPPDKKHLFHHLSCGSCALVACVCVCVRVPHFCPNVQSLALISEEFRTKTVCSRHNFNETLQSSPFYFSLAGLGHQLPL